MRSLWRTSRAVLDRSTLRDIALVCLADAIVGASFGAISVSGGLHPWVPIVMSVLVFAGGAQFAAVGVVLAGGSPVAAVLAGLILNARHLPFGFAVADVLSGRWWVRLLGSQVMIDESVAFALGQRDRTRRKAAFFTCGVLLFTSWNAAVVLGALAGNAIGNTAAFGLDAAFPTVLLALVLPTVRAERGALRAALTGAVIAVALTPVLPAGLPVLVALVGLVVAGKPARTEQTETEELPA
ncbi:MAG TPA: AzlC family ABC transporter permease [Pseudonocardiaceae bacterium]|nr:AzlC family ABC transporter permease [Pseudonocardiaceae bacterium]